MTSRSYIPISMSAQHDGIPQATWASRCRLSRCVEVTGVSVLVSQLTWSSKISLSAPASGLGRSALSTLVQCPKNMPPDTAWRR